MSESCLAKKFSYKGSLFNDATKDHYPDKGTLKTEFSSQEAALLQPVIPMCL